jgi:hypothetical protein
VASRALLALTPCLFAHVFERLEGHIELCLDLRDSLELNRGVRFDLFHVADEGLDPLRRDAWLAAHSCRTTWSAPGLCRLIGLLRHFIFLCSASKLATD